MTALASKLRTFRALSAARRRLALKTIGLVAVVRIGLSTLPFRYVRRFAEAPKGLASGRNPDASAIVWAVRLAARYVPGASCLTQALSAQYLLNRSGIPNCLHIGVALGSNPAGVTAPGGFAAHAWVEHDGRVLIGGVNSPGAYAPMLTWGGQPDKV